MAEYGPGFYPTNADFIDNFASPSEAQIAGLIAMSAFALIGIIPLFTVEAMAAGTALDGAVTTAAGNTYYGITLAAAEAQEAAFVGGTLSQEGATSIISSAVMNGGSSSSFTAGAIIALFNYDASHATGHFYGMGNYIGGYNSGGNPFGLPWGGPGGGPGGSPPGGGPGSSPPGGGPGQGGPGGGPPAGQPGGGPPAGEPGCYVDLFSGDFCHWYE